MIAALKRKGADREDRTDEPLREIMSEDDVQALAEMMIASPPDQLRDMVTEKEVLKRFRMSRSTLHRMQKEHKFPDAIYPAPNTKRYFLDVLVRYQNALAEHDQRDPNRSRGKGRRPRQRVSSSAT